MLNSFNQTTTQTSETADCIEIHPKAFLPLFAAVNDFLDFQANVNASPSLDNRVVAGSKIKQSQ